MDLDTEFDLESLPTQPEPWYHNLFSNIQSVSKHYSRLSHNEQVLQSKMPPNQKNPLQAAEEAVEGTPLAGAINPTRMAQSLFNTIAENAQQSTSNTQAKRNKEMLTD